MKILSLIFLQIFSLITLSDFINCAFRGTQEYRNCLNAGKPQADCDVQFSGLLSPGATSTATITTPVQVSPQNISNQGIVATTSNQGVTTGITVR